MIANIDALYTCDRNDRVLTQAWVVVDGAKISAVGEGTPPDGDFAERLNLEGSIAMPGLINTHHHFFQTLTRALPGVLRGHLWEWLLSLYPVWSLMGPDDLAAAAAASSAELLLTGATTTVDHLYLVPRTDDAYLEAEINAVRRLGIRLHLVRGSLTSIEGDLEQTLTATLGPRAGGLIDEPSAVLASMRNAVRRWHDPSAGSMLTIALGPTIPTWSNGAFMRAVSQLSDELDVGIHMHFHPQGKERQLCREQFDCSPLEWLDDHGILSPRTWLAHVTRLDNEDIALLARRGVGVAHCPRMIMRLGARIPYIHRMREAGLRVGIGVDGAASNDGGSMLNELRLALLLHRLTDGGGDVAPEAWLDPIDVLKMATGNGASIMRRDDLGAIVPGLQADITAFDMRGIGYAGVRGDRLSGLLLTGDSSIASLTMVAGSPLVREGRLIGQDEIRLRAAADRAADRVIDRAESLTGKTYRDFAPSATSRA